MTQKNHLVRLKFFWEIWSTLLLHNTETCIISRCYPLQMLYSKSQTYLLKVRTILEVILTSLTPSRTSCLQRLQPRHPPSTTRRIDSIHLHSSSFLRPKVFLGSEELSLTPFWESSWQLWLYTSFMTQAQTSSKNNLKNWLKPTTIYILTLRRMLETLEESPGMRRLPEILYIHVKMFTMIERR